MACPTRRATTRALDLRARRGERRALVGRRASRLAPRRTRATSSSIRTSPNSIDATVASRIRMEVVVAPADDVEIRRVTSSTRAIARARSSLTSYGEVVLAPPLEDERHPAFSKLFVHSEFIPRARRPALHAPARGVRTSARPSCCTDSSRTIATLGPRLRDGSRRVSRAHGDPAGVRGASDRASTARPASRSIRSWRCRCASTLEPGERRAARLRHRWRRAPANPCSSWPSATRRSRPLDWVIADAGGEADARAAAARRRARADAGDPDARVPAAGSATARCGARRRRLAGNRLGQPRLWGLGLSGDLPDPARARARSDDIALLRDLVRGARSSGAGEGSCVDLVVLRPGASGYDEPLRERLRRAAARTRQPRERSASGAASTSSSPIRSGRTSGGCSRSSPRVVLDDCAGLARRSNSRGVPEAPPSLPRLRARGPPGPGRADARPRASRRSALRQRRRRLHAGRSRVRDPPRARRADTGAVVQRAGERRLRLRWSRESGGGFTWAENSGEHRLTPWSNDPVSDPPGRGALPSRRGDGGDLDADAAARPEAAPRARSGTARATRAGARNSHGLEQELLVFVPPDDPVKIVRLQLTQPHRSRRGA